MSSMPLKPVSRPLQPVERRRISRRLLLRRNALTINHFPAISDKCYGKAEFCGTVFLIGQERPREAASEGDMRAKRTTPFGRGREAMSRKPRGLTTFSHFVSQ